MSRAFAAARAVLPSSRGELSLLFAGVNLMLLNFILVQHATLAFAHAEIAVIVFSLSYFSGVSLGYLLSDRVSPRVVRALLPVFLAVQMALLLGMQPLHYAVKYAIAPVVDSLRLGWDVAEWSWAAVLFVIVAGFVTSLYAIFLPRVIEDEGKGLRRCYSIEVAGSLLGLLLVPALAAISHEALMGGYFVTFLALAITASAGRALTCAMALGVVAFLLSFARADRAAATWYYEKFYDWNIDEVVLTRYTPYHKIEVVRSGGDFRLLLNGKRQFGGDPKRTYAYFVAEYPARILGSPTVCLLGCGSMATVGRIGDFVPSVRIVDLDAEVFLAARRWFQRYNRLDELHNWTFTADDAKHFIANSDESFDLILHDIPPARSRQVALTYTDEFFRLVKARLRPGGIFSISSLTPFSRTSHYGKRMVATLSRVFDRYFVLVHRGSVYFYGGGPELVLPSVDAITAAVEAERRADVTVYTKEQIDELVKDESTITIANVGDLIYD